MSIKSHMLLLGPKPNIPLLAERSLCEKQMTRGERLRSQYAKSEINRLDCQVKDLVQKNKFDEAKTLIEDTQQHLMNCGCRGDDTIDMRGICILLLVEKENYLFQNLVLEINAREVEEKKHPLRYFFRQLKADIKESNTTLQR